MFKQADNVIEIALKVLPVKRTDILLHDAFIQKCVKAMAAHQEILQRLFQIGNVMGGHQFGLTIEWRIHDFAIILVIDHRDT